MSKRRMLVLLLTAIVVAGCFGRVRRPDVRLAGLRLGGLGLRGGTVFARLSIVNPNSFPLQAAAITYDLELNDRSDGRWVRLAQDRYEADLRVDENDSTVVEIPIEFSYSGLGAAIGSILNRGTFDYRIRGEVALREPFRTELPYSKTGNVSLVGAR